jgi:hypothetical protein
VVSGILGGDHPLRCRDSWFLDWDVAIGRHAPFGYRESSFADGPNAVGVRLCEASSIGKARVECLVLPQTYRRLSPW